MSKESLTPEQLKEAKQLDRTIKRLTDLKEDLKNYKLGDIYILESWDTSDPKNVWHEKTHMGFPVKYEVVHVSDTGIPYLRKLTSAGNPTGAAFIPPEAETINAIKRSLSINNTGLFAHGGTVQRFVPDPEQLDSILLQQEFDPMAQHAEKSKLFNEINKHNKRVQVSTGWNNFKDIADFFKSLKPGDKFWTSPEKQFVIQSVVKVGREYCITATDINQATVTFNFSHFTHRRLYRERPRSFSKESKV